MATEKRLIDANALKIHRMYNAGANHPLDVAYRKDIDNAPTVEAVEVVRCWECKFWDMCSIREAMAVSDWNAYCYRGERKDND